MGHGARRGYNVVMKPEYELGVMKSRKNPHASCLQKPGAPHQLSEETPGSMGRGETVYGGHAMDLWVYPDGLGTLSIQGTVESLAGFSSLLMAVRDSDAGYACIQTAACSPGDFTTLELCMTRRLPVICSRVYRGSVKPLPETLVFPDRVALGVYECRIGGAPCGYRTHVLIDGDGTDRRPAPCGYCGRPAAFRAARVFRFLRKEEQGPYDAADHKLRARRGMRFEAYRADTTTLRAWRKGETSIVLELSDEGISELLEYCLNPVCRGTFDHSHLWRLSRAGQTDYHELIFQATDALPTVPCPAVRPKRVNANLLAVALGICMNARCSRQQLWVETMSNTRTRSQKEVHVRRNPLYCPECASPFFHWETASYELES